MIGTGPAERFRLSIEGPPAWLWYAGAIRIASFLLMFAGTTFDAANLSPMAFRFLGGFYLVGLVSCAAYLISLHRSAKQARPMLTWAQVLVDFAVVSASVSFTGGVESALTFLFVFVVLEAGLLLGVGASFMAASMATAFMAIQLVGLNLPLPLYDASPLRPVSASGFYLFIVQGLAYYLTASFSGYWNQRVRRIHQFNREILDNMNNGFLTTDLSGRVVSANVAACAILARNEDQVVGQPAGVVMPSAGGQECPIATALRTGRDFTRYECAVLRGDGEAVLVGLSTNHLRDVRGRATGLITLFSDLTELDAMREELRRNDRLAAVGELAAGLAHEIRNPVASIRGSVDELQRSLDTPELAQRLCTIALRECDHLNRIITDFLDYARAPKELNKLVDPWAAVEEAAACLRQSLPAASADRVRLGAPPPPCLVRGNHTQLRQVFENIGRNALDAMDGQGTLEIAAMRETRSLSILFNDEGPGIPPDEVARIFEPFYTTKDKGVGMGLAVCLRIITAHDGAIHVAARRQGGTSVAVRLPLGPMETDPGHE